MRTRSQAFKLLLGTAVAMFGILSLPAVAHAQLTRGAINGTVRDEAGSVVAGATVRVVNPKTNISRDTTANDEGFYRIVALEPGTYNVVIEKQGFNKLENREVVVQTSLETTFDAELKAGGITETVDVTAQSDAISLNKTNPTIGLTVSERQAEELPLSAARNVLNLSLLSPNVHVAPGANGISANGQRARNNNFTIDGSDNNDITVTLSTTPVFPEAVGEFQIQTNPYSAEYGRNSGAQINIITKSGTNDFHGDFFEFYRGSRLDALDNVQKRNGLTRPARTNRNQFGGTISGPLHIPRFGEGGRPIYDGRDRTHFFFGFQEDRTRSAGVLQASVNIPTPAGFAALQTVPLRAGQSVGSRQAVLSQLGFLGSVYQQNPVFSNVQNTTINGVPIQVGTTNLGVAQPNDTHTFIVRVDHRLGERDNATIRYITNQSQDANVISNLTFGERFSGAQALFDQNLALSETHVFNANLINEFRTSFIRRNLDFPENDTETLTVQIGGATCAVFCFGGASNFPQSRVTNYFQFSDTLSWTLGNHGLKLGGDVRFNQLFNKSGFDLKGTYTFNNLADYLNNNAFAFAQAVSATNFLAEQWQQFYFVQDDWRVTPNLTVNLGLRYENATIPLGFFGDPDPAHQAFSIPGPVQRDNNNFAPSFGFAYSPRPAEGSFLRSIFGDGTTVIRGGYRISYDLLFYNILVVNAGNFPFTSVNSVNNVVDQFPARVPVSAPTFNPLTQQFVNTQEDARTPYSQLYSLSVQREMFRNFVLEAGYTGSRALDQIRQLQMNPALLSDAQAAAVRARETIPSLQARRVNPAAGPRVLIGPGAQSTYNAGFVALNKRLERGLQFGVSYTFSRNMSNNDESLGVAAITNSSPQAPQDTFQIDREKSLSVFDRTHRFVANYLYEAPAPWFAKNNAFLRQVFGGWQISGITSTQSGQPFTVFTGIDTNGNGSAVGDRPNFNPNATLTRDPVTGDLRTFTQDPNNLMFLVPRINAANTAGPLIFTGNGAIQANSLGNGNLGRNTFRGPGFWNTNLSVAKNFRFGEDKRLRITADFLNAFNQDNYGNPTSNMNSANFGRNLNNWGNRSITVGGKFSF